ncbi:unnamed protein product, partial [Ascophyllum nodosum]
RGGQASEYRVLAAVQERGTPKSRVYAYVQGVRPNTLHMGFSTTKYEPSIPGGQFEQVVPSLLSQGQSGWILIILEAVGELEVVYGNCHGFRLRQASDALSTRCPHNDEIGWRTKGSVWK